MIGTYSVCQAKPWQDYDLCCDVGTAPDDADDFMINDTSDTTDDADGTNKRVPWTKIQPRDSDLTAIAALSTTAYGRALLELAQAANGEILIGNGTDTPEMALMTETGDALIISVGAGTINFIPHANLEALADGILNFDLYFDDGSTNSPGIRFIDETDEYWHLYKINASNLRLYTIHADDQTFEIQNAGAGKANVTVDGFVESDLYRRFNTSKPAGAEIDQVYGADGATWNPTSGDILVNHYVKYVEPPAAECIDVDDPHDCCTGLGAGATCEETWLLVQGPDGVQYVSSIELPSYAHWATAEMPYDDEAGGTPYGLTAAEVKGSTITNAGSGEDSVYTLPAAAHGFNFMVMVIDAFQMDIEPNGAETLWLNGSQMAAGEHIQNAADTKGDVMTCVSVESGDGTFEIFCNSSNANWAQATP